MAVHTSEEAARYKSRIRAYVENNYVLDAFHLPEFVLRKKGKVREIYQQVGGDTLVMIASDRVSAFDHILDRSVPFKGSVLNKMATYGFINTQDIVPNALISGPGSSTRQSSDTYSANALIQKKCTNLGVEFIVRQYLWGSMANAYEKGDKQFCGQKLKSGLYRYQKLDDLMFTPTTKSDVCDENMTMHEVEKKVGEKLAHQIKDLCIQLFKKGSELYAARGMILLDTKYEFGINKNGSLCLIDEVNTPDSSRMCDRVEYENKYTQIHNLMETKAYKNVSELLKQKPELKIREESKQYVRDLLLEKGFKPGGDIPSLTDDEVIECSYRYICVYERLTGNKFQFPTQVECPKQKLLLSLKSEGLIKGYCIIALAGSDSDMDHLRSLKKYADSYEIPFYARICSAHKQPSTLERTIEEYNLSSEPVVLIACAGMTDALSGTASYLSVHPVVSCPPDAPNLSCVNNPPMSSNAYVQKTGNAVRFAAQILSISDQDLKAKLLKERKDKIDRLTKSDKTINQLL